MHSDLQQNVFHLALPVVDLEKSRKFYQDVLGLEQKRSSFNWIDFDFFGHQLSLHLVNSPSSRPEGTAIDGDQVPARHYGLVVSEQGWNLLRDRLREHEQAFLIGPKIRFQGKEGEQGTFFVADPDGNYLEFKYFSDGSQGTWY